MLSSKGQIGLLQQRYNFIYTQDIHSFFPLGSSKWMMIHSFLLHAEQAGFMFPPFSHCTGELDGHRLLLVRHLMFPSQSCGTSLLTRPLTISYALHRSLHWLVCLPPSPISLCSGPGIPYIAYILGLDTLLMLVWM
jgi:hypothetical protein